MPCVLAESKPHLFKILPPLGGIDTAAPFSFLNVDLSHICSRVSYLAESLVKMHIPRIRGQLFAEQLQQPVLQRRLQQCRSADLFWALLYA